MTSAETAKRRIQWCIAQRRNRGAWIPVQWEMMRITTFDGREYNVEMGVTRARWVRA